jgi:hypothetical protein
VDLDLVAAVLQSLPLLRTGTKPIDS